MKLLDYIFIFIIFVFIFFISTVLWLHYKGEQLILDAICTGLEKKLTVKITYTGFNVNWLQFKATVNEVKFQHKDNVAKIKKLEVKLGFPKIFEKKLIISEMIINEGEWFITKENKSTSYFPDFIKKGEKPPGKLDCDINKIIYNKMKLFFTDNDRNEIVKISLYANQLITVFNYEIEVATVKGCFKDLNSLSGEYFINLNIGLNKFYSNFQLILSGKNTNLTIFNQYQFAFTNLMLKEGVGSFSLNLVGNLGLIEGYVYLNAESLNLDAFNNSIFSTVMGLSYQSFLSMIKENNNNLELDFYIHGTTQKPILKLGNLAKGFLINAPVTIAKDTLSIVEKLFNVALLGIPRKIMNAGKSKKSSDSSDDSTNTLGPNNSLIPALAENSANVAK